MASEQKLLTQLFRSIRKFASLSHQVSKNKKIVNREHSQRGNHWEESPVAHDCTGSCLHTTNEFTYISLCRNFLLIWSKGWQCVSCPLFTVFPHARSKSLSPVKHHLSQTTCRNAMLCKGVVFAISNSVTLYESTHTHAHKILCLSPLLVSITRNSTGV